MAARPRPKSNTANTGGGDCPWHGVIAPVGSDSELPSRVGYLEGEMQTLTTNVQEVTRGLGLVGEQLNKAVAMLGSEIGELRNLMSEKLDQVSTRMGTAIDTMAVRLQTQAKPNWQVIVMGVGMAGGLLAFIFSTYYGAVNETKGKTELLSTQYAAAQYERGKTDERAYHISQAIAEDPERFRELASRLQRETVQINLTTEAKLKAVDERLQAEIAAVKRESEIQLRESEGQIADFRKWRIETIKDNSEFRGCAVSRLNLAEERLKTAEDRIWQHAHDDAAEHRGASRKVKD